MLKKENIRVLISHWNEVWWHYRNSPNNLLNKDKLVKKLLIPGSTLAWNSLGIRYHNHIDNLTIYDELLDQTENYNNKKFNNILVLNALQLRYITVDEYCEKIIPLSHLLSKSGRMQIGFNSSFLHWNRVAYDIDHEIDRFKNILSQHQLVLKNQIIKPFKTAALNGDCTLIFDKL